VQTGFSKMPGGPAGAAATVGGFGIAVSVHSAHREEAIKYLLYLARAQIKLGETQPRGRSQPQVRHGPAALDSYGQFEEAGQGGSILVNRPAIETGRNYRKVSEAYAAAVHSVLTGQKIAQDAATQLEAQLINLTGFKAGGPRKAGAGAPPRKGQ
jgi:trehalose/maltose transport system substrate-binding protein